jgi:hypothetical protein
LGIFTTFGSDFETKLVICGSIFAYRFKTMSEI